MIKFDIEQVPGKAWRVMAATSSKRKHGFRFAVTKPEYTLAQAQAVAASFRRYTSFGNTRQALQLVAP